MYLLVTGKEMSRNLTNDSPSKDLRLLCITNKPDVARVLQSCGVDWIFVDLEVLGKEERQAGRNSVKSNHTISDVRAVGNVLDCSQLIVRVNPWGEHSPLEVEEVVYAGADIVMLPYFSGANEVAAFVDAVGGRAKVCLLLETPAAVDNLDDILNVPGVDHIHIGLNDLHLAYDMWFMFELLSNGTVERICHRISESGISYGFGGCARVGMLVPPSENVLAEHFRLGSSSVILSRSFCNLEMMGSLEELAQSVEAGVKELRECWRDFSSRDPDYFINNRKSVVSDIEKVRDEIIARKIVNTKGQAI